MFDYLEENWEMLCDDIEKGIINPSVRITPDLYKEYSKKFKPNPKRAQELRAEFKKRLRHSHCSAHLAEACMGIRHGRLQPQDLC